jgi:hypothetical protein
MTYKVPDPQCLGTVILRYASKREPISPVHAPSRASAPRRTVQLEVVFRAIRAILKENPPQCPPLRGF